MVGAMLYDRWRAIARDRGDILALEDLADGRRWSFRRLAEAAETFEVRDPEPWVFPHGTRAEFVLQVLAGWRTGRVVCPLESGQPHPHWAAPPTGAAHVKTTSGSTGVPRGVWFTGEQLAADADQIVVTMGLRPEWPALATLSLAHSYGFSNLVLPLLLHGIPLHLAPAPLPEIVRRAGTALGDLTLPAVPVLWRTWFEAGAIPGTTRLAISAGAPLPLETENEVFESTGLKVHNFYGASECGGIAYDGSATPRQDTRQVGLPLSGVRLETDPSGCLVVHSRAAGSGYFPETDPRLSPGRFATSDLAVSCDTGWRLLGRAADTINVAGRKVHPEEVETVLRQNPQVRDCIVFGIPDPATKRGEVMLAWVVPRNPEAATAPALREFLQERLPPWKAPQRILVRDNLPVNERGKISRAALRDQFATAGILPAE